MDINKLNPADFTFDEMAKVISQMPTVFLHQFFKISCYYLGYRNIDYPGPQDKSDFINETFNSLNMISKVLALSTNSKDINDDVYMNSSKNNDLLKRAFKFFIKNADEVGLKYFTKNTDDAIDIAVKTDTVDNVTKPENTSKEIIKDTVAINLPQTPLKPIEDNKPEVKEAKKTPEPEPVKEEVPEPQPEPVKEEPKPESVVEEVTKEEPVEEVKPEPITEETPEPIVNKKAKKSVFDDDPLGITKPKQSKAKEEVKTEELNVTKAEPAVPVEENEPMEEVHEAKVNEEEAVVPVSVESFLKGVADAQTNLEDVPDDITALDVFNEEMKLWGVDESLYSVKALKYIIEHYGHDKMDKYVDVIILRLAKDTGKPKPTIVNSFKTLIKKADFSKSKYFPMLATIKKSNISYTFLIQQFLDLIID